MQLISVGLARSIWLFDVNDLNPTGKSFLPDLLPWLGEKYSFQKFPKSVAEMDKEKKGFIFETGEFQSDNGPIQVNFSFYSDGVVAETWSSTEGGDAFLGELLRSAANKYSLAYKPEMIRTKSYVSEVVVQLDHHLNKVNPKAAGFCDMISNFLPKRNLPSFEVTGMSFAPDTSGSSYKPPGLYIERRANTAFTENRFWSKSPFTTADHLSALEEFEKLLVEP
jgi:hypothetical protein